MGMNSVTTIKFTCDKCADVTIYDNPDDAEDNVKHFTYSLSEEDGSVTLDLCKGCHDEVITLLKSESLA